MTRISPVNFAEADDKTVATLNAVKAKIGMVPNLFATFARAPAVLQAYLAFADTLAQGKLNARQREILSLSIAQANRCQYCLSAHTLMGKGAGLNPDDIRAARTGAASQPLDHAIAALAVNIVRQRGQISDADLISARAAGMDDELILEVIAQVALNTLTNYTNNIAATAIDFPVIEL